MTITLDSLRKKRKFVPPRVLLYAANRLGKSTAASDAPDCIIISTEPVNDDEIVAKFAFPRCESYLQVVEAVNWLLDNDHPFKAVAIDSADWVEKLIKEQVCAEKNWPSLDSVKFNKEGYLMVLQEWTDLLQALDVLRQQKGMMVIFTAKEAVRSVSDHFGGSYPQAIPALSEGLNGMKEDNPLKLVVDWCDIVGLIRHNLEVKEVKAASGGRKGTKAEVQKGDCARKLHLAAHPSYLGGNRYGLPDMPFSNPFDWEELLNRVKATF